MSLLAPGALALATLALPLIALYMLRSRRRKVTVSSTLLWEKSDQSVSSAVPWQRLPITLPLLLQLAILAVLVFLLARPFTTETTVLGPHTVFVFDTSGSMAMAGRFAAAQDRALELAGRASSENLISVVTASARPEVAISFSGDPDAVRAAIEEFEPGGDVEDLAGAVRLARGLETPDRPTSLLLFSDGGDPDLTTFETPIGSARHLIFDSVEDNLSLASLAIDSGASGQTRVFVEVANAGEGRREVEVVVEVDDLPLATMIFEVGANGRGRDVATVDAGAGAVVRAQLVGSDGGLLVDGLDSDNRAEAVVPPETDISAEIEGEGSVFLRVLVDALARPPEAGELPNITIADRVAPETIDGPTWLIRPPAPPEGISITGVVQNVAVSFQSPAEPILDGADLSEMVVGEAQIVEALRWLPIVSAGDVPLILLGEVDGHRAVYFTFDLVDSNFPVQLAFPIVGARIIDWLGGQTAPSVTSSQAGAPIVLVPNAGELAIITRPDGNRVELASSAITYGDTAVPGIYRVEYVGEDDTVRPGGIEVRTFAPSESLGASQSIPVVLPEDSGRGTGAAIRELAPLLLLLVLIFFAIEWWVTHQRPRLREAVDRVEERRPVSSGARR